MDVSNLKRASSIGNPISSFRNGHEAGELTMRRVEDVIKQYDVSKNRGKKKILLIQWFQKHPGKRFDRMEVHSELGEELDVGQKSVGDYLNELADENVLKSYGSQRISYQLADDIIIPVKYQALAGFRHLYSIFDTQRWGVSGFLVIAATLWAFLTFPFWFFSFVLFLSPRDSIGTIHQSEMLVFAIVMTGWLVILLTVSFVLYRVNWWWTSRQ